MLDNYISEIEGRINEAERLKDEAAVLLKEAYATRENVKNEIEKCKKESEERILNLKKENEDHIAQVEKRMNLSVAAGVQADLLKNKDEIFKKVSTLIASELEALIFERKPKIRINADGLDKLK